MKKFLWLFLFFLIGSGYILGQLPGKFGEARKNIEKIDLKKLQENGNLINTSILKQFSSIIKPGLNSNQNKGDNLQLKSSPVSLSQLLSLKSLSKEYDDNIKIRWNERNGTVSFMEISQNANKLSKTQASLEVKKSNAINFITKYSTLFKLDNPERELKFVKSEIEDNGRTHLKYQQYYNELRVWGSEINIHLDAYGNVQLVNGRYEETPNIINGLVYSISQDNAISIAMRDLNVGTRHYSPPSSEKVVYYDLKNKPHLAFFVELKPTFIDIVYYFIDGLTGEVIHKYNNTKTDGPILGSGVDLLGKTRQLNLYQIGSNYYMIDVSKDMFVAQGSQFPDNPKGAITVLDLKNAEHTENSQFYFVISNSTNIWPQNAVSLSYALSKSYDYYKNIHGIKSWDNNGMNIYGVVNLGQNYLNAYSTGPVLFFGNGDNQKYTDFTKSIDIIGHEYGHSVTTYHSNLEYQFQSGALNEAYSDYSGTMIEYYEDPNNANWLIGEKSIAAPSGKIAGRDMANPANSQVMDQLPTKMSEYMNLTADQDHGGVHINCGIINRAIYLIAQSIGRDKMEKIIYRAYTKYLTQKSQFIDLRLAAIQSAKDLYPGAGYEVQIGQAFDMVEIFDGTGTKPPQEIPPVTGQDYILMLSTADGRIYRVKSTVPFDQSSLYAFNAIAKNKPSVTEDGSYITFVGQDGNIYIISVKENKFYQVTTDGKWNNVAISPKADYIAAIPNPNYEPSKMYIISVNTSTVEAKTLYLPNTSENNAITYAYYADIVDFSINGEYLLYDCYSAKKLQTGGIIDTWEIMLMRRADGTIVRVFPPTEDGVLVGNPTFANTKENIIAFDLVDARNPNNVICYVCTYNLFSSELGLISENSNWIGHPSFSPDDKKVVFQTKGLDGVSTNLSQITMSSDGLNAVQSSKVGWITNAMAPVWYATGSRPNSVEKIESDIPKSYELLSSYPNPFNSTANIRYYLPKRTKVKIEIYNLIGNKIKELFNGESEEGYHNLLWNADNVASGTYICRMTTPETAKITKLVLIK